MVDRKVPVDLASGTLAGAAQLVVGHPFDTIKVKLQSGGQFHGAFDATFQTLRKEGLHGFYKGMGAPLVTVAAFNAILFSSRGFMTSLLAHKDGRPLTAYDQAVSGAGAGLAVSFLATPTELLKCRLQAQGSLSAATQRLAAAGVDPSTVTLYRGPGDVVRQVMVHEGGVIGLFRGMTPTLCREVPGNAIMFGVYELVKQQLAYFQGLSGTSELGTISLAAAGAVAGASFWGATYPMDVIKSKIQIDCVQKPTYAGVVDCVAKVHASEGTKGLYRGFAPCFARSFPANAAAFLVYELTSNFLGSRWG